MLLTPGVGIAVFNLVQAYRSENIADAIITVVLWLVLVRGLSGGLNETTIAIMRTWRCHPALKDGKPVPILLPFTTTFRLY